MLENVLNFLKSFLEELYFFTKFVGVYPEIILFFDIYKHWVLSHCICILQRLYLYNEFVNYNLYFLVGSSS